MNTKLNTLDAALKTAEIIDNVPHYVKLLLENSEYNSYSKLGLKLGVSKIAVYFWLHKICRPSTISLLTLHFLAEQVNNLPAELGGIRGYGGKA